MFITIALPAESVNTCLSINLHPNSLLLTTWNRYFAWATFLPLLQSTHCNPVFLARLSASTCHWAQRECWKRICYLQHLPRVGRGSGDGNFCSSLLPQAVTLKLWHLNREHKLFITSSTLQHWCLHYPGPYRRKTNHAKPNQNQPTNQMKKTTTRQMRACKSCRCRVISWGRGLSLRKSRCPQSSQQTKISDLPRLCC